MSFPQGIYFRATNNQSDPTDYDWNDWANTYPTVSSQGNNCGWSSIAGLDARDRDVASDVRLKGINFAGQAFPFEFRIQLPATGNYKARCAMGDGFPHNCRLRILDGSTVLVDVDPGRVPGDQWADATGVIRTSDSDWVTNNALTASLTFSTTDARFKFGNSSGGDADPNWVAAAVYLEAAAAAAAQVPYNPWPQLGPMLAS